MASGRSTLRMHSPSVASATRRGSGGLIRPLSSSERAKAALDSSSLPIRHFNHPTLKATPEPGTAGGPASALLPHPQLPPPEVEGGGGRLRARGAGRGGQGPGQAPPPPARAQRPPAVGAEAPPPRQTEDPPMNLHSHF